MDLQIFNLKKFFGKKNSFFLINLITNNANCFCILFLFFHASKKFNYPNFFNRIH